MRTYALLVSLSFALALLLTPLVREIAHRFGWLDQPGERKLHSKPTPRLGGVAIVLAFGLSLVPLLFIHNPITEQLRAGWPVLRALPVALAGIFLLGLADDLWGVNPYVKLAMEAACSLWVYYHGIFVGPLSNPLGTPYNAGILSMPLTLLWLVGITNAFNLVDGIDGLVGGIALFGIGSIALISMFTGGSLLVAIFAALGGAVAGFLVFNFHPASIFLGDSGSLFLGFTLASLSLVWGQKSSLVVTVLGPILIFALPIADTLLAVVRRYYAGAPMFAADRDHIHHRLIRLGLSPRKAVLILYAACFLFGLTTLALMRAQVGAALAILVLVGLVTWLVMSGLGYHEIAEINQTVRRGLFDQGAIIRQRVQFRKAVDAVGEVGDLESLWARLVQVATDFDFDGLELSLHNDPASLPNGHPPSSPFGLPLKRVWPETPNSVPVNHTDRFWRIELSLAPHAKTRGFIAFSRALDKGELHFRIETFAKLLATNIQRGLDKIRSNPA